jgi:hypothetical protein
MFAVKTMFGLKVESKAKTMSVSTRVRPEHRFKHRNFALQSTAHSKLSALGILDLAETPNPCPNTTHIRVRVRPNPPNTPKMCDAPLSLNKMNSMIARCLLRVRRLPEVCNAAVSFEIRARLDSQHNILAWRRWCCNIISLRDFGKSTDLVCSVLKLHAFIAGCLTSVSRAREAGSGPEHAQYR